MDGAQPENAGQKQARGRFRKGQSGNPRGKPKGARNLVTRAVDALLEGDAEKLTQKCIALALDGDGSALRLCMERIAPVRKGRPITLKLPSIATAEDLVKAVSAVVSAVAAGEITPEEAATVATVLEVKRKALETSELDRRIAALEVKLGEQQ